jgi:hypothetical protein
MGWTTEDSKFKSRKDKEFFLLQNIQNASGAHQLSYSMRIENFFPPMVKRPKRESDHSPPTSAKVKKAWFYTFISPYYFMA